MKKSKRKASAAMLIRAEVLDQILALLKDANQKLDYLIKNLRRFNGGNGHHNHLNHTLTQFMD